MAGLATVASEMVAAALRHLMGSDGNAGGRTCRERNGACSDTCIHTHCIINYLLKDFFSVNVFNIAAAAPP